MADGQFPKMLYKDGEALDWNGSLVDTLIVSDAAEEEIALADGWRLGRDPLDHDGDGKKGGSRKKAPAEGDA